MTGDAQGSHIQRLPGSGSSPRGWVSVRCPQGRETGLLWFQDPGRSPKTAGGTLSRCSLGSEDEPAGLGQRLMVPVGQTTRPLSRGGCGLGVGSLDGTAVQTSRLRAVEPWGEQTRLWRCLTQGREGPGDAQCPEPRLEGPGARRAGGKDDRRAAPLRSCLLARPTPAERATAFREDLPRRQSPEA